MRFLSVLLLLTALLATVPRAATQADQRCFLETGFCIAGRIRSSWERNDGLARFGYPLGHELEEVIEGQSYRA